MEGGEKTKNCTVDKKLKQLYDLGITHMDVLVTPRKSTEEEDTAPLMIVTHKLEVSFPPRFLVQIMAGEQMAKFIDLFKAMEYPLFAHLAPGQRVGENMPKQVLFTQMRMGAEAAASQKQAIAEFKNDLSRVPLDMNTRVLTVYLKGKKSAQTWVGWKLLLNADQL